jgi:hypothetical protein
MYMLLIVQVLTFFYYDHEHLCSYGKGMEILDHLVGDYSNVCSNS